MAEVQNESSAVAWQRFDETPTAVRSETAAEAWRRFHETQTEVLGWMTESDRFKRWPQHRAKAYHAMMEALAMAYNFAVAPRMSHPRLQVSTGWFADMYTLGQNGPDRHDLPC